MSKSQDLLADKLQDLLANRERPREMAWLDKLLNPAVIGPLIGMVAVIGYFGLKGFRAYLEHEERIEKIRQGMDPDDEA
jgi:hypothetical protein